MPPDQMAEKKSVLASTSENAAFSVEVGQVLVGKYRVDKILGKGGMGVVVSAMHLQLQERVALKFLLPSVGRSEEFTARFLREAKVSAKLRNEHAVKVSDVGVLDNGAPYMVMEYLEGKDLNKILRHEAPLEVARALDYIIQACEGLAEAHAIGVVHRDLKPSNLFVTRRRDGTDLVKVLDFGISKAHLLDSADMDDLTAAGTMMGSPKYMSPEQLTDTARVDERADVWSLAVMLYEMLTGTPPFVAETHALTCMKVLGPNAPEPIRSRRDDVSPELEDAILHALDRDLSCRTRNVAEFAEEVLDASRSVVPDTLWVSLERIRGTLDSRDHPDGVPLSATSSQRLPAIGYKGPRSPLSSSSGSVSTGAEPAPERRRRSVLLAAMLGGLLVLGGALFLGLRHRAPEPAETAASSASASTAGFNDSGAAEPTAAASAVAAPATSLEAAAETSSATDTATAEPARTAHATPARWVPRVPPPPRPAESAAPPAPRPPPTKPFDPLSERQ